MKLYIPEIGDQIVLTEDWTFNLYSEDRNRKLMDKLNLAYRYEYGRALSKNSVTLPKGTSLKIDRIYIRKGSSDYSSITFFIGSGDYKGCRFWAKLSDVNKIEFDPQETEKAITVKFSTTMNGSEVGSVKTKEQYDMFMKCLNKQEYCKVNGKHLVEIRLNIESANLTAEECKEINRHHSSRSFGWAKSNNLRRETDVKITKFDIEAYSLLSGETGTFIGKAQTTSALSQKIKKYFKGKI